MLHFIANETIVLSVKCTPRDLYHHDGPSTHSIGFQIELTL